MSQLESYNSEYQRPSSVRIANELRARAAGMLSNGGAISHAKQDGHCHFSLYRELLPINEASEFISFNGAVTDFTLREFVLKSEDPNYVALMGAKVVEQHFQVIFGPKSPTRPLKNLAVAKHFGTFFTSPSVANQMFRELPRDSSKTTLLDPCVGGGTLLCAALLSGNASQYTHLVGIELDALVAIWGRQIVTRVAFLCGFTGNVDISPGDGLRHLLSEVEISSADKTNIIINPPYGRLRLTSDRATNSETALKSRDLRAGTFEEVRSGVAEDANWLRGQKSFANESGILEKSRLFFRACSDWARRGSGVSIISPDSWMSGNDSASLRKHLLAERLISKTILIAEKDGDFSTVNQSTSITVLSCVPRDHFEIQRMNGSIGPPSIFEYPTVETFADFDTTIPKVSGASLTLYRRLASNPKFSDKHWIINARGEVDQTSQKAMFCVERTKVPVVRGEHVCRFVLTHTSSVKKPSFLNGSDFKEYIAGKPKEQHFAQPRIVGRQCSYAQQSRRLIFCSIGAKVAIGNSCNYLVVESDEGEHDPYRHSAVLGLLNSAVLDWYFRVGNSNNHVGNYEIDGLPFPSESKWFDLVSKLSSLAQEEARIAGGASLAWLDDLLEAAVLLSYGITSESELAIILDSISVGDRERVANYVRQLERGVRLDLPADHERWFNNKKPALSELDMRVISHVPEGGNWQNIPARVPSERLKQIRQMSAERGIVRTTYYGRLRRDHPAYTINTYFNRPGNGTHIHPKLDRTLTSREAARLQSFPDSYLFLGNEGAVRNQIGNAVPPILSKSIGESLIQEAESGLCVDVFCGAGGLSLGLERAGWHVLAAIDNDAAALDTYAFNRPCDFEPKSPGGQRTAVYRRDLHMAAEFEDVTERILTGLNGSRLDLLVGGPPCQGFSHAGFRLSNDRRNDLASIYLHFVERLNPRIFLLENVEGLLTSKGGQVVQDICATLAELGYSVSLPIWKLSAEQYGAPQMRKRVFIVATNDMRVQLQAPAPTHVRCHGRREADQAVTRDSTLKNYHNVADALSGLSLPYRQSELMEWLRS